MYTTCLLIPMPQVLWVDAHLYLCAYDKAFVYEFASKLSMRSWWQTRAMTESYNVAGTCVCFPVCAYVDLCTSLTLVAYAVSVLVYNFTFMCMCFCFRIRVCDYTAYVQCGVLFWNDCRIQLLLLLWDGIWMWRSCLRVRLWNYLCIAFCCAESVSNVDVCGWVLWLSACVLLFSVLVYMLLQYYAKIRHNKWCFYFSCISVCA